MSKSTGRMQKLHLLFSKSLLEADRIAFENFMSARSHKLARIREEREFLRSTEKILRSFPLCRKFAIKGKNYSKPRRINWDGDRTHMKENRCFSSSKE